MDHLLKSDILNEDERKRLVVIMSDYIQLLNDIQTRTFPTFIEELDKIYTGVCKFDTEEETPLEFVNERDKVADFVSVDREVQIIFKSLAMKCHPDSSEFGGDVDLFQKIVNMRDNNDLIGLKRIEMGLDPLYTLTELKTITDSMWYRFNFEPTYKTLLEKRLTGKDCWMCNLELTSIDVDDLCIQCLSTRRILVDYFNAMLNNQKVETDAEGIGPTRPQVGCASASPTRASRGSENICNNGQRSSSNFIVDSDGNTELAEVTYELYNDDYKTYVINIPIPISLMDCLNDDTKLHNKMYDYISMGVNVLIFRFTRCTN